MSSRKRAHADAPEIEAIGYQPTGDADYDRKAAKLSATINTVSDVDDRLDERRVARVVVNTAITKRRGRFVTIEQRRRGSGRRHKASETMFARRLRLGPASDIPRIVVVYTVWR